MCWGCAGSGHPPGRSGAQLPAAAMRTDAKSIGCRATCMSSLNGPCVHHHSRHAAVFVIYIVYCDGGMIGSFAHVWTPQKQELQAQKCIQETASAALRRARITLPRRFPILDIGHEHIGHERTPSASYCAPTGCCPAAARCAPSSARSPASISGSARVASSSGSCAALAALTACAKRS